MNLLDYLTLFATFAISADVLLQIKHIYHTKSSRDISIAGLFVRFIAILILMFKFASLGDFPLAVGHTIIMITFAAYFALAVVYFIHRKDKK